MKKIIAVVLVAMTAIVVAIELPNLPVARITVHVNGEDGRPLQGVNAGVTFEGLVSRSGAWGAPPNFTRSGKTDANGFFSAQERAGFLVHYGAGGDGYYWSRGTLEFKAEKEGRYQPWSPTVELVVKKIKHPIPMYARRIECEIPAVNEQVGFDLMEADWVAPHGHGKSSDFLFKITKRVVSFHDFGAELLLSFPNNGDGFSVMRSDIAGGSELRSSHEAPDSGYTSSLSLLQGNSKERGQYGMTDEEKNYFFRVRTVLDERGQVVSCLYGKIYGRIEYFPVSHKAAKLRLTYYLNPTSSDRNVEFDPKHNLFNNLKTGERVTAP